MRSIGLQYIVKLLIFVEHLIPCISWVGQSCILDLNEIIIYFSIFAYNLKSTNSSIHEHIQCPQTHEIK